MYKNHVSVLTDQGSSSWNKYIKIQIKQEEFQDKIVNKISGNVI